MSDQQGGEGEEEAQQEAGHEQADASHQHSDQAAQQAYADADTCTGLDAQLGVQHMLLVAEQENDDRAEHQTGQEHHSLKAAVTCGGETGEMCC